MTIITSITKKNFFLKFWYPPFRVVGAERCFQGVWWLRPCPAPCRPALPAPHSGPADTPCRRQTYQGQRLLAHRNTGHSGELKKHDEYNGSKICLFLELSQTRFLCLKFLLLLFLLFVCILYSYALRNGQYNIC